MKFEEWYDENKEVLTCATYLTKLRKAYEAGLKHGNQRLQDEPSSPEPECAEGRI